MANKRVGLTVFFIGVFFLHMNSTIGFLWLLIGLPAPAPPEPSTGIQALLPGFITPLGALIMITGGLIYGLSRKEQ
ncbi:hypothetical protein ACFL5P_01520 [candidate division KSB1 bacterium]